MRHLRPDASEQAGKKPGQGNYAQGNACPADVGHLARNVLRATKGLPGLVPVVGQEHTEAKDKTDAERVAAPVEIRAGKHKGMYSKDDGQDD